MEGTPAHQTPGPAPPLGPGQPQPTPGGWDPMCSGGASDYSLEWRQHMVMLDHQSHDHGTSTQCHAWEHTHSHAWRHTHSHVCPLRNVYPLLIALTSVNTGQSLTHPSPSASSTGPSNHGLQRRTGVVF